MFLNRDVLYLNNIYKTKSPDTGVEIFYPVVDRDAYFDLDTAAMLPSLANFVDWAGDPTNPAVSIPFYNTGVSRSLTEVQTVDPLSFRNFDHSQEDFASNVTVSCNAVRDTLRLGRGISSRRRWRPAKFRSLRPGSDGNYYFDVEATPDGPPTPGSHDFDEWFLAYGGRSFSYEISLDGAEINNRVLTNADGGDVGYHDVAGLQAGTVAFQSSELKYGRGHF